MKNSLFRIERYETAAHKELWNGLVDRGKNQTFLFNRNFMDYHEDRFTDYSLMVFDEKKNLLACFPANQKNKEEVVSHQGLTYGGIIIKSDIKLPLQIEVFKCILKYYFEEGIKIIQYKHFPRFYNNLQTDEIEYCLFLSQAKLYRRDTAIAIDRQHRIMYSGNIRREAKKAQKSGMVIKEDSDFKEFWIKVLIPNLKQRFNAKPVHSFQEIEILKRRFPKNIRLFTGRGTESNILAGTVLFSTENVVHCQYIAANDKGRSSGVLNLLFTGLLDNYYQDKRFFDFGIVNENQGKKLNSGMLAWKERMGGRSYSHDFYEIETANYRNLPDFS